MKFTPCLGDCSKDDSYCSGCGRSREEINQTKALTNQVTEFIVSMGYENPEDFLENLTRKVTKRLSRMPSSQGKN